MSYLRAGSALLAVVLLAGCGNVGAETTPRAEDDASASPSVPDQGPDPETGEETDQETGQETSPSPDESTAPSVGGSGGSYVPGDPQNSVRPGSEQELASWPECAQVWRGAGRIPGGYAGCQQDGDVVVADRIDCSFGGAMTTFEDRYYGVVGNVVNDAEESLSTSDRYAEAYRLCTG